MKRIFKWYYEIFLGENNNIGYHQFYLDFLRSIPKHFGIFEMEML